MTFLLHRLGVLGPGLGEGQSAVGESQVRERTGGPDREAPYVTVYTAWGLAEAHIVKGRLETEDIPVVLEYESAAPAIGLTVGGLSEVRLRVPEPLAERAQQILQDEGIYGQEATPEVVSETEVEER